MYKNIVFLTSIFIVTLLLSFESKAAWLSINNSVDWQIKKKAENDFTYQIGASAGIQPSDYFALTLDFDKTISNKAWGFNRFSIGIISQSPINKKSYDYYPYIGVGIGFVYATDSVDIPGTNPPYEKSNLTGYGISVPVMAGIKFNVLSFLLVLDVRYTYANATMTHKTLSTYKPYKDLSSFTASLGIGYLF